MLCVSLRGVLTCVKFVYDRRKCAYMKKKYCRIAPLNSQNTTQSAFERLFLLCALCFVASCKDTNDAPNLFNPASVFSSAVYDQIGVVNPDDLTAFFYMAHHEKMLIHNPIYPDDEGNDEYAETIAVFNDNGFARNRSGVYCLNKELNLDNDSRPQRNTYHWDKKSLPKPLDDITWTFLDGLKVFTVREQLPDSFGYIRFSDSKITENGGTLRWQNYDVTHKNKVSVLAQLGKKNGYFFGKELKTVIDTGAVEITKEDLKSLKFDTNTVYVLFTLMRANGKSELYKYYSNKKVLSVATVEKGILILTEN